MGGRNLYHNIGGRKGHRHIIDPGRIQGEQTEFEFQMLRALPSRGEGEGVQSAMQVAGSRDEVHSRTSQLCN